MKLKDIAKVIRSKNAGPFCVTFDIMFTDQTTYEKVKKSGAISAATVARLYDVPVEKVQFFEYDPAWSFKASIPRPVFSGDIGDSDIYGAQQHAPLLDIEVPV